MFGKRSMGQMRGMMGGGVPKGRLATVMLEILVQLPVGTTDLKNVIIQNLGFMASLASTRDINAAWNDGSEKILDKKISTTNFKKLNTLAESESCSTNDIITKLIKVYKKHNMVEDK